jgi:hypothetical protein
MARKILTPSDNIVDIAWAAGFIDGEGHFSLRAVRNESRRNGVRFYPRVIVGQTKREPLDRLASLFQGAIRLRRQGHPGWRPVWEWSIAGGRRLRVVLPLLSPHLSVKREECDVLLEFVRRMADGPAGPLSSAEALHRLELAERLRALKASGRGPRASDPVPWTVPAVRAAHGNAKLTREQVDEIRASPLLQRELAERFGVSRATIGLIKSGRTWRTPG